MLFNKNNHSFQLEANRIACSRGDHLLFNELSFIMNNGDLLQIVGPNGIGKTTLLRVLTGIIPLQAGEVCWQGKAIQNNRTNYYQQLSYLGHRVAIKNALTVLENIRLESCLDKQSHYQDIMETLGLAGIQHRLIRQLSRGQRQRVAWAKLLLSNAMLWILDEPFASLDEAMKHKIQGLMAEKLRNGGAVIMTSHRPLNAPGLMGQTINLGRDG